MQELAHILSAGAFDRAGHTPLNAHNHGLLRNRAICRLLIILSLMSPIYQ